MGTADGDRGKTGERKDECDDKLDTSDGSDHSSDTDSDSTDGNDENVHANDRNSASSTCIEQDIPARVPALQALYTFIIRSCFDKASTVRMRAMFHLLPLIENDDHCAQLDHYARKMFEEAPKVFVGEGEVILNELEELEDDHEEVLERMFMDDSEIVINNLVLHIILSGIVDDTVGVRKYSTLVLQVYFPRIRENSEAESAVNSLKDRCLDSSQMVRRQAALTLDHLLYTSSDFRELLENCWLTTVLPMINDRERNVQLLISQLVTDCCSKYLVCLLMFGHIDGCYWRVNYRFTLRFKPIVSLMFDNRTPTTSNVITTVTGTIVSVPPRRWSVSRQTKSRRMRKEPSEDLL